MIEKPKPLKEEPLKEPEMPDIKVPVDFLQKIAANRADAERFEQKVKQMQEKNK